VSRRLFGFVVLAAVPACNYAKMVGGMPVSSDGAIDGTVLATWTLSDCRDAAGEPLPPSSDVVRLVRQADGRFVLVDARPAYDTLIITNGFLDRHARHFELAVKSSSSAPVLRKYSLPAMGKGPGTFTVFTKDWDSRETQDGFVAWFKVPSIACVLLPRPQEMARAGAFDVPGSHAE